MSSLNTHPLFMLQEVVDDVEHRSELISFSRHWIHRHDGVVFVLSCRLTTESHPSSGRAILATLNSEARDEEGLGVDEEVGHPGGVITVRGGGGVEVGVF